MASSRSTLVRRHPWWRPAFSGRPADIGDGAAWLDVDRIGALATGAPRLELVRGELAAVLGALPAGSITAASVSNVPDWLDASATASLAAAAHRALAPGGRLLVRRIVRPGGGDAFVMAGFLRDSASDTLVARERTALYEAVDLYRVRRPDPALPRGRRRPGIPCDANPQEPVVPQKAA